MAKRFTATNKWMDKWFRRLDPKYKLLWIYVLDNCSNAGLWEVDLELAEMFTGFSYTLKEVEMEFRERITQIEDKWYIPKFIEFQYGELSESCKPHIPVIKELKKYGIEKGYPKGIQTLKEQEKEKDKEKEEEKDKEKKRPTQSEVREYFKSEKSTIEEADVFFSHYETKDWIVLASDGVRWWDISPTRKWKLKANEWIKKKRLENLDKKKKYELDNTTNYNPKKERKGICENCGKSSGMIINGKEVCSHSCSVELSENKLNKLAKKLEVK